MSQRRRKVNNSSRSVPDTTLKEDIETQLDSIEPDDFMTDIKDIRLSIPTIAAVVFGITALVVVIVAAAMLGQFYRTQLNRNKKINQDIAALQALVDSVMPPDHTGRFSDAEFTILNAEDLDKRFCFDAGNLTNGQKRFYIGPDKKGTLALTKQIPTNIAPFDATYLTLTADTILINERVLTFNTSIFTLTDLGPGAAFVVDVEPTTAFVTSYNRANVTVDSKGRVLFAITNLAPNTTLFFDNNFAIFDDTNTTRQMMFDCSGIGSVKTSIMTVQNASGTVAYLSDIPTVYLDNVFTVQNAVDTSKQVRLDVAGVATGTIRILTIRDLSGTVAYLSDIPTTFFDDVFAILNQITPSKRATFNASAIGLATTRMFALPDADGVLSLTSGPQLWTNKIVQSATNQVAATYLKSTATPINIGSSGVPNTGDLMTSTTTTTAVWMAPIGNANISNSVTVCCLSGTTATAAVTFVNYHQIGRFVYVFARVGISTSAGGNFGFQLSLPVPRTAGNFLSTNQASGIATSNVQAQGAVAGGNVIGVITTQRVQCLSQFPLSTVLVVSVSYSYDLLN